MFLVDFFSACQGIVLFFPFYFFLQSGIKMSSSLHKTPQEKYSHTQILIPPPPLKTSEDIADVVFAFLLKEALNRLLKEVTTGKRKGLPGDCALSAAHKVKYDWHSRPGRARMYRTR